MTNKTLLFSLAATTLFVLGYFAVSPKFETTQPPNHNTQTVAAPSSNTPVSEASAVKLTNIATPVLPTAVGATAASNPAALKTFDQFTPIERDRLRLDFDAMSEPDRLFAVISAEDEAWKRENFFPDKSYIENTDEATLERLALEHLDKLAFNAIIYKWWLRKDPRWKDAAQEAVTSGSAFAARLLLNEELNTPGKQPDIEEVIGLQTTIILSGDDASDRFMRQRYSIYSHANAGDALSILSDKLFYLNSISIRDIKAGRPTYTRRPRPRVPWMKSY